MNFDDQDWESAHPSPQEARGSPTAWKVTAGVVVGIVLGGTLVYALDRFVPQLDSSESANALGQAMRDGSRTRGREPVPAAREAIVQDAFPASRDEPLQPAPAEPQPAAASAITAAAVRAERKAEPRQEDVQKNLERKERAWAEFYKKPRHCIEYPTADTLVECANHYVRTRREFEQSYAEGSR